MSKILTAKNVTILLAAMLTFGDSAWASLSDVLNMARQAERKSDWKHALTYYRKVSQAAEYREEGKLGIARACIAIHDYEQAEDTLNALINEENPFQFQARLLLSQVLNLVGKFESSYEEAKRATRLRPKATDGYEHQAVALWSLKKKAEIETLLVNMGTQFPISFKLLLYRGKVRLEAGQLKEAITDLKEAQKIKPNELELVQVLGEAQTKAGLYAEAEEQYVSSLKMFPNQITLWESAGQMYFAAKKYDEATNHFKTALDYDSSRLDSIYMLGQIQYRQNNLQGAEDNFRKVLRKNPNHEESARGLVTLYKDQAQLDDYAQVLKGQVEKHPDRKWAATLYVKFLVDMNLLDEAERLLDRVAEYVEKSSELMIVKALIASKKGAPKRARDTLEAGKKTFPEDKVFSFNLGLVCEQLEELDCAEKAYLEIVGHPTLGVKGVVNLAILYEKQGKLSKAIELLKARRTPASPNTQAFGKKIRELEFKVSEMERGAKL